MDSNLTRRLAKLNTTPQAVGPRPADELLELQQGYEVWVEYGHDHAHHLAMHRGQKAGMLKSILRKTLHPVAMQAIEAHMADHEALWKGKPDASSLTKIYTQYKPYYSGKAIDAAVKAWKAGEFNEAAAQYEKARNGFQREKNPFEWNTLEAWRAAAEAKANQNDQTQKGE